ncbi:B4GALT3 [Bugula neritina]|uniref:Beta-1,4-galactosyltransferase n=1 Tax=Bugula neritina TaxID=10212 RepID=A0A7J7KB12_BUGNE|nr:B4GALT3 [Bugula neritina]
MVSGRIVRNKRHYSLFGKLCRSCFRINQIKPLFLVLLVIFFLSVYLSDLPLRKEPRKIFSMLNRSALLASNYSTRLKIAEHFLFPWQIKNKNKISLEEYNDTDYFSSPTPVPLMVTTPLGNGTVQPYELPQSLLESHKLLYNYSQPSHNVKSKQPCPLVPHRLVGKVPVVKEYYPIDQLNSLDFRVKAGGTYTPPNCEPLQKIAIVIPFRQREMHLSILLLNLHPYLQRQESSYTIFVVNQIQGSKFNRAMLMNIGFMEAMKRDRYTCVIFHDVDLIPFNDKSLYRCPKYSTRHLSVYIDKFDYRLPYKEILGGVVAISSHLFIKANGYSNQFFGWGGEDDDFQRRCESKGVNIVRYPKHVGQYMMIKHGGDSGNEANPQRTYQD